MKIGYLVQLGLDIMDPPFNGPANHVRHLVEQLIEIGHEVRVVFKLNGKIYVSTGLEKFRVTESNWTLNPVFRIFEKAVRRIQSIFSLPYAGLFESLHFAAACQKELQGFDLLYERTSWMGYGGGLASRWMKIPLVLEDNGDHLADLESKGIAPHGMRRSLALFVMRSSVNQASRIISCGDGWRDQYIQRYAVDPAKIVTVENGTTLINLLQRQQLKSFRPPSENDKQSTSLVYLGGFDPWHGIPVLLQAFALALQEGLPLHLTLIGAGVRLESTQQQADELGLNAHITFAGQLTQEKYAPLLAQADIGLSPYCGWPEYSGLKIFDYKAAGLPTIASGEGGRPRTLSHARTGWIVLPCNENALLEAIRTLAQNPDLRRTIGQQARIEAETIHSWLHTAQQVEEILFEVVGQKPLPNRPTEQ